MLACAGIAVFSYARHGDVADRVMRLAGLAGDYDSVVFDKELRQKINSAGGFDKVCVGLVRSSVVESLDMNLRISDMSIYIEWSDGFLREGVVERFFLSVIVDREWRVVQLVSRLEREIPEDLHMIPVTPKPNKTIWVKPLSSSARPTSGDGPISTPKPEGPPRSPSGVMP
jgi:hypothetical protein